MKLQVKDSSNRGIPYDSPTTDDASPPSPEPFEGLSLEGEVEAMVHTLSELSEGPPDMLMRACMAYMGRCTEIWLQLLRIEPTQRRAKTFRVMQLQKAMDLIEFEFKGASRLIEVARQEVELSR